MRNLPVPRRKGMYIIADSKREANRIDVPFGRIADPVGEPVRRCYSLFNMAREAGLEKEWLCLSAKWLGRKVLIWAMMPV